MSSDGEILSKNGQMLAEAAAEPGKPYCKPRLMELGDLRTLTLGVSPVGFWDSGGGFLYENYP
jgi:hypothetical protein